MLSRFFRRKSQPSTNSPAKDRDWSDLELFLSQYPGDEWWKEYVSVIAANDSSLNFADDELARVLVGKLGDQAAKWLDCPVPVLGGRTPNDVLANHPNGTTVIRTVIGRMP